MMLLSCFLAITRQIYCWLIHKVLQTLWLRAGNSQRADINVSRSSSLHSALAGALARSSRAKVIWFPAVVITTAAKCYFSPLAFSTYSIIFLGRTVLFHLLSEGQRLLWWYYKVLLFIPQLIYSYWTWTASDWTDDSAVGNDHKQA